MGWWELAPGCHQLVMKQERHLYLKEKPQSTLWLLFPVSHCSSLLYLKHPLQSREGLSQQRHPLSLSHRTQSNGRTRAFFKPSKVTLAAQLAVNTLKLLFKTKQKPTNQPVDGNHFDFVYQQLFSNSTPNLLTCNKWCSFKAKLGVYSWHCSVLSL